MVLWRPECILALHRLLTVNHDTLTDLTTQGYTANAMKDIQKLALEAARENSAAAAFLVMIVEVLHFWDDLIDKDVHIEDSRINNMFTNMLVNLPTNPFFAAHTAQLAPVLLMAIQNWRVATDVERGYSGGVPLEAAFAIRSNYVDLVTMVATLCGGFDHGFEVAKKVRALAHSEGYEQYISNLAAESRAREE